MTLQPFGDTERQEKQKQDKLDSDVLDLNHSVETLKDKVIAGLPNRATTPSSLLSKLPSIPFISSHTSDKDESPDAESSSQGASPTKDPKQRRPATPQGASRTTVVPNPIAASEGEDTELPAENVKLSDMEHADLPAVEPGTGDGPEVLYGKGVVLDMAGYHSRSKDELAGTYEGGEPTGKPSSVSSTLVATLTDDLRSSAKILGDRTRPPMLHHSVSEPPAYDDDSDEDDALDAKSEPDISGLSLLDDRSVRAKSEPPDTPPPRSPTSHISTRPHSPHLIRTPNGTVFPSMMPPPAVLDLAWDWGGRAKGGSQIVAPRQREGEVGSPPLLPERTRSESMPITQSKAAGRLKNVEENPYLFVLEMASGRAHSFELSLCGSEGSGAKGDAAVSSMTMSIGETADRVG